MAATSPQKRRATSFRSSMLDQPMRQTRSMARISDVMDFSDLSSASRPTTHRSTASSSQPRSSSPRKARASQAAQLDSFDNDTPDVSMAPCMESPKKGRFDDFEFELENSIPEVPTRRRKIAAPRQASTSPSADVGLPRSKTSATLTRSTTSQALHTSRKENTSSAETEQQQQPQEPRAGASPTKPVIAPPRISRLHGPTPALRTTSQEPRAASLATVSAEPKTIGSIPMTAPLKAEQRVKPSASSRDSSHRLLFGPTHVNSTDSNPFSASSNTNSLAMLGEPRHSPVKRLNVKSEYIISSPDRPDRKPINLLELKPSPGKAQRGIFRHNSIQDDEDEDDDWDESGSNTVDEIKLVKGPSAVKKEAKEKTFSSEDSASSSSRKSSMPRATSTLDVKHTLSTETSDALASLEASLAKLKSRTKSPPSSNANASRKQEGSSGDSTLKRELGTSARPFGMTSSQTQVFRAKPSISSADRTGNDSSFSIRSTAADQSVDSSGVFKRPSGRVSALAKSRVSSSDQRNVLSSTLSSSQSVMSFGAPRLSGYGEVSGRNSSRPPMATGSRTSSLELTSASDTSRAEEDAAQAEEEARVAEAKRQAELKASKRKSMSSILSSGMPPPLLSRREAADTSASSATSNGNKSVAEKQVSPSSIPADSVEARKAAKAARRRSLYTYVPTKREDADSSIGNISTNLGMTSEGDTSAVAPPKKQRFLRGLTVLVDVRDQDGEDASACWIERLKNAGAKVMVRFGERKLTHIVYKSGRPSTLHSYRALDDPKPFVVGISWVVACLEQGKKVDEEPYLVEVAKEAIFANRRRSSMAPKQVPSSATSIRELPQEMLKGVEQAKKKLLAHAPAVPSPLRRRVSSRTILASRLAATSISDTTDANTDEIRESENGDSDDAARLEAYSVRVRSVLSQPTVIAA